jgi:hypothetical protein
LAADQIIAGAAVLLTFERLAALRPPRRQLPTGAILTPGVEHLAPG